MAISDTDSTVVETPEKPVQTLGTKDLHAENEEKNGEEISHELSGPKLGFIIFGLALAVFLIALDTSIVATASFLNTISILQLELTSCTRPFLLSAKDFIRLGILVGMVLPIS